MLQADVIGGLFVLGFLHFGMVLCVGGSVWRRKSQRAPNCSGPSDNHTLGPTAGGEPPLEVTVVCVLKAVMNLPVRVRPA